jgi:hypothetical protein
VAPRRRPALLALAGLLLLAACGGPGYAAGGPRWDADGIRFTAPTGWQLRPSGAVRTPASARLFYLATQPLADDCSGSGEMQACRLPVDALEDGGLMLWWHRTTCAGAGCTLPDGSRTQVGDREAVMVDPAEGCGQIGQTDASAWLVQVSPQRLDAIVVCTRNADAETLATLRELLAAVDWRTP